MTEDAKISKSPLSAPASGRIAARCRTKKFSAAPCVYDCRVFFFSGGLHTGRSAARGAAVMANRAGLDLPLPAAPPCLLRTTAAAGVLVFTLVSVYRLAIGCFLVLYTGFWFSLIVQRNMGGFGGFFRSAKVIALKCRFSSAPYPKLTRQKACICLSPSLSTSLDSIGIFSTLQQVGYSAICKRKKWESKTTPRDFYILYCNSLCINLSHRK